jgi:hypothetical protein
MRKGREERPVVAGEVIFTPTEGDFVAAQGDHFGRWTRGRRGLLLFLVFPAVFALMGLIQGESSLAWNMIGYGIAGVIIGGITLVMWRVIMPLIAKRMYRQQRSLHKEFRYGWSPEGLSCRTKYGSGIVPWHELHRWSDGRDTFLFYVHDRLFYFVPYSALTPEQVADLRQTVAEFGPPRR